MRVVGSDEIERILKIKTFWRFRERRNGNIPSVYRWRPAFLYSLLLPMTLIPLVCVGKPLNSFVPHLIVKCKCYMDAMNSISACGHLLWLWLNCLTDI